MTNCVPVYDIKNAGPKHRYVVRTKSGDVYVCHNCGYGTGPAKLADTLIRDKATLDPDREKHRAKARELHQMYRSSNRNIVAFWQTCQRVIEGLVGGAAGFFGGPHNDLFRYGMVDICGNGEPVPSIVLPTGYVLRYPNLRMEVGEKRAEFFYDRPMGRNMVKTRIYGGALTENLTQALAFQILMWQAVWMNNAGIRLACNIHDSFAAVVPDAEVEYTEALMLKCMKMVPPWVEGLPLDAEAETATDFTIV